MVISWNIIWNTIFQEITVFWGVTSLHCQEHAASILMAEDSLLKMEVAGYS
jgi:hypothetical protein